MLDMGDRKRGTTQNRVRPCRARVGTHIFASASVLFVQQGKYVTIDKFIKYDEK